MTKISPENLDCMSIEDLNEFVLSCERAYLRRDLEHNLSFVNKIAGATNKIPRFEILRKICEYARLRIRACRLRLSGDIQNAFKAETAMQWIYERLPNDVRW